MTIASLLHDLIHDYTLRTVALGSATLGLTSGALGAYAVLRRQSLLGDAISHAALPGIAIAFLLTGSKAPLVLLLGAAAAGWLATLKVLAIVNTTRIKTDSALGLVLSVFFGFGLMLLTFIQKRPDATQAGLDKFLFGQAAALLDSDVATMVALGLVALLVMMLLWKEFKLLSFDPDFGASLGYPMRRVDILLTSLLVVAIVMGLQTVGVVLMSSMIVAPAAAARQWTDRLGRMIALSALFGALAGAGGAVISSLTPRLPTGPVIVLCATAIVLVSIAVAPRRGMVWQWLRELRNRRRLQLENVLVDLFRLAAQHETPTDAVHSAAALRVMGATGGIERTLRELASRGLVCRPDPRGWALTEAGLVEARRLLAAAELKGEQR